jgi:hypothetical protein
MIFEIIFWSAWLLIAVSILLAHVWPRITWHNEDWRHLRLPDDWDKDKSRGRIKERKV